MQGSVVVLYSGRWYVNHMSQWVQNHVDCLINPFQADVVVTVPKTQLFCGDTLAFRSDAHRMFGTRDSNKPMS